MSNYPQTHQPYTQPLPRVVIAHQSAIPHYRVPFYQKLNELSNGSYSFTVAYDPSQAITGDFANETLHTQHTLPILPAPINRYAIGRRQFLWQPIRQHLQQASLLITDTHLSNLGYPWAALTRPRTCKWALWGHATNRNLSSSARQRLPNKLAARVKQHYVSRADAFLAYTETEGHAAISLGIHPDCAYVVGNTIDLRHQRSIALCQQPSRDAIRSALGFSSSDYIIITVGRMLPGRRIDFLLDAFRNLHAQHPATRLVIIGGGQASPCWSLPASVTLTGPITDPEHLGRYLTAADLYVAPGMVGLGILQPLAHELPIVAFDLETHGPEIDYLNKDNATILARDTDPSAFARHLHHLVTHRPQRWNPQRYKSIAHLTLDAMAKNFDHAIRQLIL